MSMSVDGLISGMDTTSLIQQLLQVEAGQQSALKTRLTTTQTAASAYRTVNTTFAAVRAAAEALSSTALTASRNATTIPASNATASASTSAIDEAIKTVSTQRADLGAIQNRFDHTINNLNVAVENLTASESRIRDADMAQEMVQFTRNQILSQAGTAMLAQANQASQGVLSLLR